MQFSKRTRRAKIAQCAATNAKVVIFRLRMHNALQGRFLIQPHTIKHTELSKIHLNFQHKTKIQTSNQQTVANL